MGLERASPVIILFFFFLVGCQQVRQYHRLKEDAGRQSARYLQELDSVNREQKTDQDRLDNEGRVRGEKENQLRQRTHELEETQKRSDKLTDHIRTTETVVLFVCIFLLDIRRVFIYGSFLFNLAMSINLFTFRNTNS